MNFEELKANDEGILSIKVEPNTIYRVIKYRDANNNIVSAKLIPVGVSNHYLLEN